MNDFKKIIIKLGTSSITQGTENFCRRFMLGIVQQIAALQGKGVQCILVSSGAVAMGRSLLCHSHAKQVLASVGQIKLMQIWSELFSLFDLQVGQILLTYDDFSLSKKGTTRQAIEGLLFDGIIPILNENDAISAKELRIGNNDHLAVLAGRLVDADLIALLTDQEGLYTANPRLDSNAKLIPIINRLDESIFSVAKEASPQGTGGMATKLEAAKLALDVGIRMAIAHSSRPNVLIDLAQGLHVGTLFKGES
jgi:glutamate 5-kinase